jgi:hypothetical protein
VKLPCHTTISPHIPLQFCEPESSVSRWEGLVAWATVPEATIEEDRNLDARKDEVRLSRDFGLTSPTRQPGGA